MTSGSGHSPQIRGRIFVFTKVFYNKVFDSKFRLHEGLRQQVPPGLNHSPRIRSGISPFGAQASHLECLRSSPSGLRPITSDAQREFTFGAEANHLGCAAGVTFEAQANHFVTLGYIKVSGSTFVRANVANSAVDCTKIASSTFDDTLREATPVDPL